VREHHKLRASAPGGCLRYTSLKGEGLALTIFFISAHNRVQKTFYVATLSAISKADSGMKITFPDEDDASTDVSNWHLVAYLVISFVPFSQCTLNVCFLNIFSDSRIDPTWHCNEDHATGSQLHESILQGIVMGTLNFIPHEFVHPKGAYQVPEGEVAKHPTLPDL
jgi:hypothetical protein